MRKHIAVLAAAVLCCGSLLSARVVPDFSGRWTTEPEPAAGGAATGQGAGAAGQRAGGAGQGGAAGQRAGGTGQAGVPGQRTGGAGPGGQAAGGPGRGGRGDMGSGWGPTITITQNEKSFTVEYTFFSRGDMQPPLKFVYDLTGTPTTNTVMMGRGMQSQTATAKWDGDKLVITTAHTLTDPATGKPVSAGVTQTLTLESPTSLIVETTRAGVLGGAATTTKSTYRKVSP